MNHLADETSPYLLQHARNPVDWWPWTREAFEEARRRDVPVFLSVGYSTCYWCHVMERESFESEAIARLMNERLVCIKLDREERPDVDEIYMAAVQLMTGHGGWPMSVFVEPHSLKPFWCGTYLPDEPRMGMPSFPQVVESIAGIWAERRSEVLEQADQVAQAVRAQLGERGEAVAIGQDQIVAAVQSLLSMFDRQNGGFGGAPKFPQPVFLDLLLEARQVADDDETRDAIDGAVRTTLDRIATGGIHDHLAGGFHRYSVDAHWIVPHFEKMLYDNALLSVTYARAAEVFDDDGYRRVVRSTLDYVLGEMTTDEGAFASAQDAESEQREGLSYLWMPGEFDEILGEDARFARSLYGLDDGPNFRDPHHPDEPARHVLRIEARHDDLARRAGAEPAVWRASVAKVNSRLLEVRSRRIQPERDDKVITAWNGLMIAAMAVGGRVCGDSRYTEAAVAAVRFILSSMRDEEGHLFRTSRAGRVGSNGFLEDSSCLALGLTELARTTGSNEWQQEALQVIERAEVLFGDPSKGGFFDTRDDQPDLFVRSRSTYDGAVPCGTSVMLHALIGLHEQSADDALAGRALACLGAISGAITANPLACANSTRALLRIMGRGGAYSSGVSGAPAPEQPDPGFAPVELYADVERITVGPDHPAQFRLAMRIADGWHVVAAMADATTLQPFRVGLASGTGVAVYADYPDVPPETEAGEPPAYVGSVEMDVAVEYRGPFEVRPILGVTYQACTNDRCLAPTTVELDIALDEAAQSS